MKTRFLILPALAIAILSSCSRTIYIVRHAEKAESTAAMMSADVPLTEAGRQRADAIRDLLLTGKIRNVFSTNTIRTRETARPTAEQFGLLTEIYGPRPDSAFIELLRSRKGNSLVVGHSNTVDDIVNMLCGSKRVAADLADTEYNRIFIVELKGKKATFREAAIYREYNTEPRF